jgi:lipoate-protein ligase A
LNVAIGKNDVACVTHFAAFAFEEIARWPLDTASSGAAQMALDEVMLQSAELPILRVYQWSRPEITFGYPQHWDEARDFAAGRPATRRCTGGGFVEHGDDVTIAIAVPASHPFSQLSPIETYRRIHQAIRSALDEPAIHSATVADKVDGAACFASPAPHDLLHGSKKILGGAQRRSRDGFLYQGSLQATQASIDIASRLAGALAKTVTEWIPPAGWKNLEDELIERRYSCDAWNRRR